MSIKQPAPIELYEALGSLYSRDPIHCLNARHRPFRFPARQDQMSSCAETPASPSFTSPNADIILRTSDGVDFHLHKLVLGLASDFFGGMFGLPQPAIDAVDAPSKPIIPVEETSTVMDCLLRMFYPGVTAPKLEDVSSVGPVLLAALKYEMKEPVTRLRVKLSTFEDPLRVFAFACRCSELEHEARQVAVEWCEQSTALITDYVEELDNIPAGSYFRLLHFYTMYHAGSIPEDYLLCSPQLSRSRTSDAPGSKDCTVLPPFDKPSSNSDVIIRSSGGSPEDVDFYVNRDILSFASAKICKLLDDTSTPLKKAPEGHCILPSPSPARIVHLLLQLTYPFVTPEFQDWETLTAVVEAAESMGMVRAAEVTKKRWVEQIEAHPLRSYFVAMRNGWAEEAHTAAKHAQLVSVDEYVPEMETVPARTYRDFLRYRQRCRSMVVRARREVVSNHDADEQAYAAFFSVDDAKSMLDYMSHRVWVLCGAAAGSSLPQRKHHSKPLSATGLDGMWPVIVGQLLAAWTGSWSNMTNIVYRCDELGGAVAGTLNKMPVLLEAAEVVDETSAPDTQA